MSAPEYPTWICSPCGEKYGRGWPEGHCASWHQDTCDLCGQEASVTEPRDFGHLKRGWEKIVRALSKGRGA